MEIELLDFLLAQPITHPFPFQEGLHLVAPPSAEHAVLLKREELGRIPPPLSPRMPTPYSEVITAVKRTPVFDFQKERKKKEKSLELGKRRRGGPALQHFTQRRLWGGDSTASLGRSGEVGMEEKRNLSAAIRKLPHAIDGAWPRRGGKGARRAAAASSVQPFSAGPPRGSANPERFRAGEKVASGGGRAFSFHPPLVRE